MPSTQRLLALPRFCRSIILLAFACATAGTAISSDYAKLPLAKGFDFPVGPPDSSGYYKARGFWPNGHMGEDWNGKGGGNTDLGDPVYSIADGIVVQSRDVRVGWGNVVIIRHVFRDTDGKVKYIDALYGHLNNRSVVLNQRVKRGQKIGTIGTNRGMYLAHLHFEIRKNLYIGMHRSKFSKTYANYYSPTSFIRAHRQCASSSKLYAVPINTFAPYPGGRPVAKNGATPAVSSAKSRRFSIPVASAPRASSPRAATPTPRVVSRSKPLDPRVQKVITENRKSSASKPPQPPPKKRGGLLSRLRLRFSKDKEGGSSSSRSASRKRGFSNR